MKKQELMTLISQTLLGQSTFSFYKLNDLIREKLNDWFDNSKGYYSTRINAFTITITYQQKLCYQHVAIFYQKSAI